jgi:predicted Ser/Thr protein kinase
MMDSAVAEPLSVDDPQEIGSFHIIGLLGAGGMGEVYLGAYGAHYAAVKRVRARLVSHERFEREVGILYRVPVGVGPRVLASDSTAERPWFATDYVPGLTVDEAVRLRGPLPAQALWLLLAEVAGQLAAVHAAGIVHRDVKPGNVMLVRDGVKLIDFGIARAADQSRLTRIGGSYGTQGFSAPEQQNGEEEVSALADVYGLGALALYAASGRTPGVVPDAEPLRGVDPELVDLVGRCLATDPAERPTAAGVADAARGRLVDAGEECAEWPEEVLARIAVRQGFAETPVGKMDTVPPPEAGMGAAATPGAVGSAPGDGGSGSGSGTGAAGSALTPGGVGSASGADAAGSVSTPGVAGPVGTGARGLPPCPPVPPQAADCPRRQTPGGVESGSGADAAGSAPTTAAPGSGSVEVEGAVGSVTRSRRRRRLRLLLAPALVVLAALAAVVLVPSSTPHGDAAQPGRSGAGGGAASSDGGGGAKKPGGRAHGSASASASADGGAEPAASGGPAGKDTAAPPSGSATAGRPSTGDGGVTHKPRPTAPPRVTSSAIPGVNGGDDPAQVKGSEADTTWVGRTAGCSAWLDDGGAGQLAGVLNTSLNQTCHAELHRDDGVSHTFHADWGAARTSFVPDVGHTMWICVWNADDRSDEQCGPRFGMKGTTPVRS